MNVYSEQFYKVGVLCFFPDSFLRDKFESEFSIFYLLMFIYLQRDFFMNVRYMFYPPKGRAERTQWGPLDSLANLMCMRNQNWTFKNSLEDRPFLKPRKRSSPQGSLLCRTQVGRTVLTYVLIVVQDAFLSLSKHRSRSGLFFP